MKGCTQELVGFGCVYPQCSCTPDVYTTKHATHYIHMPKPIVPFDGDRPPSTEYMTADHARELTNKAKKLNSEYAKKETLSVLKTIASNAEQARNACTVGLPYEHSGVIIARLKELGYWVKVNSDPRDGETYTITW